jgi:hypothetical protein
MRRSSSGSAGSPHFACRCHASSVRFGIAYVVATGGAIAAFFTVDPSEHATVRYAPTPQMPKHRIDPVFMAVLVPAKTRHSRRCFTDFS